MTELPAKPRKTRVLLRGGLYLGLILLGLAIGTAYRLTRGPVAFPVWAVERIEDRLNRDLIDARLTIGDVALAYDLQAQALRLRIRNAVLRRDDTDVLALPVARVTLDGRSLLAGDLRPQVIDFEGLGLNAARDAEGRFSLSLGAGGGGALPDSPGAALALLDRVLATPVLTQLTDVRLTDIDLALRDDITGIAQRLTGGALVLRRQAGGLRATLTLRLPAGPGRTSDLALTVNRAAAGGGAQARIALVDLPLSALAALVPGVPALSLARARLSATAQVTLSEGGTLSPLTGRLEARDAVMIDRPALALDRTTLAFAWRPGADRIEVTELVASSDAVSTRAEGQVLLEQGVTGPITLQLRLGETVLDPEAMFETRVAFDRGLLEARVTQSPLTLHLGQGMVTGPSGMARLSGKVAITPTGPQGSLSLFVPEMAVGQLTALWPPSVQVQARRWFTTNMLGGTARQASGVLRLEPGQPPEVLANFLFSEGRVRYMRFMPPAEAASGAAQFDGRRLALRIDVAQVPALGPDDDLSADTPRLAVGPSTFVILDATQRPATGQLTLRASGEIGDILTLTNNRPLRLLDRLKRSRDVAQGQADALVRVTLPLRRGNAPADIDWAVEATLRDVTSAGIVPGRSLRADRLSFAATPEAVSVAGPLTFDGVPFEGRWRQALPPRATEARDPEAPLPPPVPLPEPGSVTGTARVAPEDLTRLGISLAALDLGGRTDVAVTVILPQGRAPQLSITSALQGMRVGLPAIAWTKPAETRAEFALGAVLGPVPEVTALSLSAPGLRAQGAITLRPEGGLDLARFSEIDTGWFAGPLTLRGQGKGVPPAIDITGGRADLRRALLRGGGAGGGGGQGSPLNISLSRLTVTEGIALTDLRATLRGGAGSFTGQINGGTPIEGVVAGGPQGATVQIRGADAGGVLRSAGLFQEARGGALQMTLRPTGETGTYDGALRLSELRVRNAPALASLLQALSVVGILEQLTGEGLFFQTVESDFTLRPGSIAVRRASAVGPSMSITADGTYDLGDKSLNMQGVISPIYLVNGLFGALFSRRDEGLFGFTYRLDGSAAAPQVSVNPLSILTPGIFRDIFRSPPPEG
ncbi:AsmA-like C-terminal region-containing protein [Jannaschia sp. M317]|uniref:AsmA-like C-terminal region-containing protein n=1 Tax=Jannaschia sp. M317 TaxID=2867011 RepID=UPI0021A447D2|nr:AsmA-like C-terminal region-containing protein [Jannaschia sp. M317]UWQ16364.1 AsmA-like C-terminal region-containing protein [Jannaschia sp. M317]